MGEWGEFYYGHSCPKWSVTEDATTPCIRYGELYTKFGTKIDKVFSYTNMPKENLRFSKGTEVLIPRVGEDPMDYNHCTWLSIPNVAIGEMISVYNTMQNPLFTATMFNATLQKEFAMRVEGGSVTNLYYEKLKNIQVSFPKYEEQQQIGTYFRNLDNLITLHQRSYNLEQESKTTNAWEQRELGAITSSYSGGTPTAGKAEYYDGDIPFIRSGEINEDKTELFLSELGYNNSSAAMVEKGDILYALYGATSGEVSISKLKGAINQAILAIKPNEGYDSEFLMQWLRNQKENIISTYLQGGQGNLSGIIVKSLKVDVTTYVLPDTELLNNLVTTY